jgi:DNA-binding transcriptional ArsR family regulator
MLYKCNMSIDSDTDRAFKALASSLRRQILDALHNEPLTTGALCSRFPEVDRCTVMQHLRVLEEADLVIPVRKGRERWNHLNPLPIQQIHERWIGPHAANAVLMLKRLKSAVEQ